MVIISVKTILLDLKIRTEESKRDEQKNSGSYRHYRGQDGAYLAELLLGKGYKVYGTYHCTSSVNFWRIEELGIAQHADLHLVEYDLTDLSASIRLLEQTEATEVYNLAAQSFVGVSFDQPLTTAEITGIGPVDLLRSDSYR